jgi:hypothetical protein
MQRNSLVQVKTIIPVACFPDPVADFEQAAQCFNVASRV